jgi:spermidine/putrescine transport system permease protein
MQRRILTFTRRPGGQAAIMLTPAVVALVVFFLLPLGFILFYSFLIRGDYGAIIYDFSLNNYRQLLNPIYFRTFLRSFGVMLATTGLSLLFAYPLAYWLAFYGGRLRGLLLFLIVVPSWTSELVRIYAWMFLLRDNGVVNALLINLGIFDEAVRMLFTPTAVIIGMVYSYFSFMLLPLYASLDRLDPSVLEAAADLGATPLRRLVKVTLPLTKGGILSGTVLVAVPAVGDYIVPDLLGGARVTMIGNLIEDKFLGFFDWPFGSAISLVLAALVVISVLIYIRVAGKGAIERLI